MPGLCDVPRGFGWFTIVLDTGRAGTWLETCNKEGDGDLVFFFKIPPPGAGEVFRLF